MHRFGAKPPDMGEMRRIDLFFVRLKLLIIMSKTFLKGYPCDKYRKEAIIQNAQKVAYESVKWEGHLINFYTDNLSGGELDLNQAFHRDHIFHVRVRLLAVMAKAFVEGNPMGHFRRKSLIENLNYICDAITFNLEIDNVKFLKVA